GPVDEGARVGPAAPHRRCAEGQGRPGGRGAVTMKRSLLRASAAALVPAVAAATLLSALASAVTAQAATAPARAQRPADTAGAGAVVPGRSVVATRFGIVATSQPLASADGVQILEQGGNAIDAAIAANATLGLNEPMMNGL